MSLGTIKIDKKFLETIEFRDFYGNDCSLSQSLLIKGGNPAGFSAVWLGLDDRRMHLTRRQVKSLITHLNRWLMDYSFEFTHKDQKEYCEFSNLEDAPDD